MIIVVRIQKKEWVWEQWLHHRNYQNLPIFPAFVSFSLRLLFWHFPVLEEIYINSNVVCVSGVWEGEAPFLTAWPRVRCSLTPRESPRLPAVPSAPAPSCLCFPIQEITQEEVDDSCPWSFLALGQRASATPDPTGAKRAFGSHQDISC